MAGPDLVGVAALIAAVAFTAAVVTAIVVMNEYRSVMQAREMLIRSAREILDDEYVDNLFYELSRYYQLQNMVLHRRIKLEQDIEKVAQLGQDDKLTVSPDRDDPSMWTDEERDYAVAAARDLMASGVITPDQFRATLQILGKEVE